jgi:hypothetical protein
MEISSAVLAKASHSHEQRVTSDEISEETIFEGKE